MITLRIDGDFVKYCKTEKVEQLEDDWAINYLSKEKIAGRKYHFLTYAFIKELLLKDEEN